MEIKPFDKKFFSLVSQPRVVSLLGVAGNFCPITRHMPFSSSPFLYGFSISKSTHTVGLIQKEEKFTLEFFDQNHRESIHALGKTSGKDIDKGKFSSLDFQETDGILRSKKSVWGMVCTKKNIIDCGDHFIVIGVPEKYWYNKKSSSYDVSYLLYSGRGWYSKSSDMVRASKNITL